MTELSEIHYYATPAFLFFPFPFLCLFVCACLCIVSCFVSLTYRFSLYCLVYAVGAGQWCWPTLSMSWSVLSHDVGRHCHMLHFNALSPSRLPFHYKNLQSAIWRHQFSLSTNMRQVFCCCTIKWTHRGVGGCVWSKAFEAERAEVTDIVCMTVSVAWYR